ncbi:MAG: GntR family transcriptional regulator [Pseudomonadota bacterium]
MSDTINRPKNKQLAPADGRDGGHTENERLADRAYRQILDLILTGEAKPGEALNERRLGEILNMSRTPVRDALLMLETEGLIARHGRLGVQIREMRIDEYVDALQIRMILEPAVARMAAGRVATADLDALDAILQDALAGALAGRAADRSQTRLVDERLHGLISDSAGNPQLTQIVRNLRRKTQVFDLRNLPERAVDACREHLEIVDALRDADGERAAQAMTRHLEQVRASILARLSGA